MKKVINSYRNITQLHSGFSSGTDWNVDIFSIADYTDIAFTSGSRLTFAKFLEPTLFSVEVPELRRPQECICLGQEKEIPGRFAHMSRLAILCLYEHAVLAPASPPTPVSIMQSVVQTFRIFSFSANIFDPISARALNPLATSVFYRWYTEVCQLPCSEIHKLPPVSHFPLPVCACSGKQVESHYLHLLRSSALVLLVLP